MIAIILIYLISFAIHLLIEYRENKRFIHNVGDLIDNIYFYMWFPLLNTFTLIVWVVGIILKLIHTRNAGVPYKMIYTLNIWAVDVMPSDRSLMMRLDTTFAHTLFHLEHQDQRGTKQH